MKDNKVQKAIIMGAGPAGITAAIELDKNGIQSTIIERETQPGGLARTIEYKGYRFDIGGHRFLTKIPKIQNWWKDILGDEFIERKRLSRIRYKGKYIDYPLRISNILKTLGPIFCIKAFLSYLKSAVRPIKPVNSFEDWVINNFGKMLYMEFFKSYTEKVWGIDCTELRASWAAQRIRGLSFFSAIRSSIIGNNKKIKSLSENFYYPRLGPGQMWEAALHKISDRTEILYNNSIKKIEWKNNKILNVCTVDNNGKESTLTADHFFSSISIQDLIKSMGKEVPEEVKSAAKALNYRDFITIALIIDKPDINPDNWLYIHDKEVKVGRIQNFKNWSVDLVPDSSKSCLGLEYFCFKGDDFWNSSDENLINQAVKELEFLELATKDQILDAKVIKVAQAYPTYDENYEQHVSTVRSFLEKFINLQLIGRNGMHKYNNQDHAMLTAILAVENILGAKNKVWEINTAEEYLEK